MVNFLVNPIYQAFGIWGLAFFVLGYFAIRNLLPTKEKYVNEGQCGRMMEEMEKEINETIKELDERDRAMIEKFHTGEIQFTEIKKDLEYIKVTLEKMNGGGRRND